MSKSKKNICPIVFLLLKYNLYLVINSGISLFIWKNLTYKYNDSFDYPVENVSSLHSINFPPLASYHLWYCLTFKMSMSVAQIYEHLTTFNYMTTFIKLTDFPLNFHESFPIIQNEKFKMNKNTFS